MKASKYRTELFKSQVMDHFTHADALKRLYEMKDHKLLMVDPDYDNDDGDLAWEGI